MKIYTIIFVIFFYPFCLIGQKGIEQLPFHNEPAKNILAKLSKLSLSNGSKILSGQQIGHGNQTEKFFIDYVDSLNRKTNKWVGMIGIDYGYENGQKDTINFKAVNKTAIDYYRKGGLVTISWHAKNPFTNGTSWDVSNVNIDSLLKDGTKVNLKWKQSLDSIAAALTELRDNNVVVLWRPFHEMDGNWFWWGGLNKPDFSKSYKKLWVQMYEYFEQKNLTNLIWVFSTGGASSINQYYPGDLYVDLVGQDVYSNNVTIANYEELISLGKPFAITEFGPRSDDGKNIYGNGSWSYLNLLNAVKERYPKVTYILSWHDWPNGDGTKSICSIVNSKDGEKYIKSSLIGNLKSIKK